MLGLLLFAILTAFITVPALSMSKQYVIKR